MEGQPGYQCDVTANDCHLLVVDRANHRLYESYQSNYNTATGQFEVRAVDTRTRTQIVTATPPSYHLMDQQICLPPYRTHLIVSHTDGVHHCVGHVPRLPRRLCNAGRAPRRVVH